MVLYLMIVPVFLVGFQWSCSAPEKTLYAAPSAVPEEFVMGQKLFDQYCAVCHPGGTTGLAPGIINKPLPEFLISFQIRNGIGLMPSFGEDVLSDAQVESITDYIEYLKEN